MRKIINKIPDWLRWLLLVPSIVFYTVASYYIMSGFVLLTEGSYSNNLINAILGIIFFLFVSGFIIQIAAFMAPKCKLLVSFIFTALILILSVIFAIFPSYYFNQSIPCILGSLVSLVIVINNMCNKTYRKQLNLDEKIVRKKRTHLYLAMCILVLIVTAGGVSMYIVKTTERNGTLFVNGKEITNACATIRYDDAVLPFTEVLKGFGFNIIWRDSNIADITYEDKAYVLNLVDTSLIEKGFDGSFLLVPPGDRNGYIMAEGRELFIDDNTIECVMYDIGEKIDVEIDRDKSIVYVTKRKD